MERESKYKSIYRLIGQAIDSRRLKEGSKLPAEGELMEQYSASRDTVRKALNLLEADGYIQKARGKVSVVLPRMEEELPGHGNLEEQIPLRDSYVETEIENLDLIESPSRVREIFGKKAKGEIYELIRIRKVAGERLAMEKDYFKRDVIHSLPLSACRQKSIHEYLAREQGLEIGYAVREIVVEPVSTEDRWLLDLEDYDFVLVLKSYTYLSDNQLFQYTESRYRPDKFRFVDMTKKQVSRRMVNS